MNQIQSAALVSACGSVSQHLELGISFNHCETNLLGGTAGKHA